MNEVYIVWGHGVAHLNILIVCSIIIAANNYAQWLVCGRCCVAWTNLRRRRRRSQGFYCSSSTLTGRNTAVIVCEEACQHLMRHNKIQKQQTSNNFDDMQSHTLAHPHIGRYNCTGSQSDTALCQSICNDNSERLRLRLFAFVVHSGCECSFVMSKHVMSKVEYLFSVWLFRVVSFVSCW